MPIVFLAVIVLGGIEPANGATITVGLGESYDFDTIQAGIDGANDGDEVLVAPGEYTITEPVTLRGKAITVKSEAGPEQTIIRMDTPSDINRGSVVIFENNETTASVLDGFTINGGKGFWVASASALGGGGIFFNASSGTVSNCVIVQNTARYGGGIFCNYTCSPSLIDCIIAENSSIRSVGGVAAYDGGNLTLTNCIITKNSSAESSGGGVMCWDKSLATLTNCIISENSAFKHSGVMCWDSSSMTLSNCTIAKNSTGYGEAGVFCGTNSSMIVTNCTITENSASSGYGAVLCMENSLLTITNSIIWGNTTPGGHEIWVMDGATFSINYSNVDGDQTGVSIEGGTLNWGMGNIVADPLFAEPGYWADINDPNIIVESDDPNAMWIEGDYHLKTEAGRWNPYSESWVQDEVTSPCIDRGDPNSPLAFEPDPNGGIINMGAYGGTPEASMSIGMLPPLHPLLVACWKLDETDGNVAYDCVGGYDGILHGEPLWQPTGGMKDGSLELDGVDDYISTPRVLPLQPDAFSIFAWIKGGALGQVILSQANRSDWLTADTTDGSLITDLTFIGKPNQTLSSQAVITDGEWHRVGLVWDSTNRILYVDDTEVASDTYPSGSLIGDLQIGAGNKLEAGTLWSGLIDDVRIYNRVISP